MELAITNSTSFNAQATPFGDFGRQGAWTVIVKATYDLGNPGALKLLVKHSHLTGPDSGPEDPGKTAPHYESDFVPFKPRADALCIGKAYPPRGVNATECLVGFGVGAWLKSIRVIGNRRWVPSFIGLTHQMTRPEPFRSMPISYENAFGGKDAGNPDDIRFYPPNPIGKGFAADGRGLDSLPLPNLEDPKHPIKSWQNNPVPMGFGPVGRTWEPRIRKAGTYDKHWLEHLSPKLPEDFQEAFYNCAPEDQQIEGYLRGDEEVRVINMHPDFPDFRCRLPGIRIRALLDHNVEMSNQFEEITMNLDTLWVDMEALQMVLVWRGRIPAEGLEGQGPILIVEEPLHSTPLPAESYRPELDKHLAEENEAELEVEALERELEQMEAEHTPEAATPSGGDSTIRPQ